MAPGPESLCKAPSYCALAGLAPHATPSGGGPAPTPDRRKTPAAGSRLGGIDRPGPGIRTGQTVAVFTERALACGRSCCPPPLPRFKSNICWE
jgi:hypothetical protein